MLQVICFALEDQELFPTTLLGSFKLIMWSQDELDLIKGQVPFHYGLHANRYTKRPEMNFGDDFRSGELKRWITTRIIT